MRLPRKHLMFGPRIHWPQIHADGRGFYVLCAVKSVAENKDVRSFAPTSETCVDKSREKGYYPFITMTG